jgi:hypothetical protein
MSTFLERLIAEEAELGVKVSALGGALNADELRAELAKIEAELSE